MTTRFACRLGNGQQVSASVGWASDPLRPVFVWYVDGALEPQPAMLERGLDGEPARVVAPPGAAALGVSDAGGVVDPGRQELDAAGEAVRAWVDSLSTDVLLAISRRMAGDDLSHSRERVKDAHRVLSEAERRVATAELTRTALDLEDGVARDAALGWVPYWTGSAEDLRAAAEDLVGDCRSLAGA